MKTIREDSGRLFYKIFNQDKFPTLNTTYEGFLKFKEDVILIIDDHIRRLLKEQRAEIVMELKRMRFATTHHEVATVLAAVDTLITKLEQGEEK